MLRADPIVSSRSLVAIQTSDVHRATHLCILPSSRTACEKCVSKT